MNNTSTRIWAKKINKKLLCHIDINRAWLGAVNSSSTCFMKAGIQTTKKRGKACNAINPVIHTLF